MFADDLVEQVAAILGIENGRATHDYSHLTDAETEDYLSSALADASHRLQTRPLDQYDETTVALVHAAARGDVTELTRMAATGASVDMAAPGPLPGGEMVAKGVVAPQPEMTPLIAAVVNRQQNAVAALLALGAKPDLLHHLHGSAVHVAAGMGNVTALEALLDAGGNPVAPGLQTQTPIQAVAAGREAFAMMDHTRQLMEELGLDTTALDLIGVVSPAADDWSRCEDLLRSRGATD